MICKPKVFKGSLPVTLTGAEVTSSSGTKAHLSLINNAEIVVLDM